MLICSIKTKKKHFVIHLKRINEQHEHTKNKIESKETCLNFIKIIMLRYLWRITFVPTLFKVTNKIANVSNTKMCMRNVKINISGNIARQLNVKHKRKQVYFRCIELEYVQAKLKANFNFY